MSLGNVPRKISEFNPFPLSQVENGNLVKVLDSDTDDLPKNWKNMNIEEEYGHNLFWKTKKTDIEMNTADDGQISEE